MTKDLRFKAFQFDWENHSDIGINDFAFFQSRDFKNIFGVNKYSAENQYLCEGYLIIVYEKKKIYLRYKAIPQIKSGEVKLSYENLCKLGIPTPHKKLPVEVIVKPTNWFVYNYNNINLNSRWSFRAAFWGLVAIVCIDIPQFLGFIINLFR